VIATLLLTVVEILLVIVTGAEHFAMMTFGKTEQTKD